MWCCKLPRGPRDHDSTTLPGIMDTIIYPRPRERLELLVIFLLCSSALRTYITSAATPYIPWLCAFIAFVFFFSLSFPHRHGGGDDAAARNCAVRTYITIYACHFPRGNKFIGRRARYSRVLIDKNPISFATIYIYTALLPVKTWWLSEVARRGETTF